MAETNDDSKKWDFIEDPEKVKYREIVENCASSITSSLNGKNLRFNELMTSNMSIFNSLYDKSCGENGSLKESGILFESHPVMDGHRCAECFDTKVYTRCFYNPKTHRSFYFCRNCSESFTKQGYKLLE